MSDSGMCMRTCTVHVPQYYMSMCVYYHRERTTWSLLYGTAYSTEH